MKAIVLFVAVASALVAQSIPIPIIIDTDIAGIGCEGDYDGG